MYINFKSKYKRIFWILLGFVLSCIYVHKVSAYNYYGLEIDQQFLNSLWSTLEGKSTSDLTSGAYNSDYIFHQSDYPYVACSRHYSQSYNYWCYFYKDISKYGSISNNVFTIYSGINKTDMVRFNYLSNTQSISTSVPTVTTQYQGQNYYWDRIYTADSSYWSFMKTVTNFTIPSRITQSFEYVPQSVPNYLQGYKKITLSTNDRYYMLSGISEGYVFIPTNDFLDYGGRLSYYDNDLNSQPYTSYIQDYITMPDGEFVRQSFNLSNYSGADWVMFSKYIYLEGEDNITYDIYVPNDIYDSDVEITPNTSGGNNFDFDYKDGNGDIQSGQIVSTDLSQVSPLLGNIFSDFSSNTFGLTSIITAPLGLIFSLSSSSCTSLSLPLPYVNTNLTLPCMTTVYQNSFGSFFTLYQTITFGIVAYWVIVKIFNIIKDAKNPDHDEIEVIDL